MSSGLFQRLANSISLARFRGVLPIIVCFVLCIILINFGLLWLTGPQPRAYALGEAYLDWKYFERAADTASALRAEYLSMSRATAPKPFVVYTGMSTAIEGIDPRILAANAGCNAPIMGFCGTGASMSQLLTLQQPLLDSDLRPSQVIVCLHPGWLAAEFDEVPPNSLNPAPLLRQGSWHAVTNRVSWWNWIAKNRFYVNHVVFRILYAARIRLGTSAGTDPWSAPERMGFLPIDTERQASSTLTLFQSYGWFDTARYAREQQAQAEALRTLISGFRSRGTQVSVVIMPEGSAFRSRVPAEAKQFLLKYLRAEFRTPSIPVLDFQEAIPDSAFVDQIHLNDQGRSAFTLQLARAMRGCGR